MFLSINRKIVYLILTLTLSSCLLFVYTFYMAYSVKIEKDQQLSIQRNQQYNNLLLNNINTIKELKNFVNTHNITIDPKKNEFLYSLIFDTENVNFLVKEQQSITERNSRFTEQYSTIRHGVTIITLSTILQLIFIFIMGWIIKKLILTPINNISAISEQITVGNLNLRIPERKKNIFVDELDRLSSAFNTMLDTLQNMMNKIKEEEKFLQSIIDSIPDGIRVIDNNYNIIIANKSYYRFAGAKARPNVKCYTSSFGLKSPCNITNAQCPLHEILVKKHSSNNIIQQFSHSPNNYLAVNAAPLFYDSKHHYIIESIRDLSQDIDFSHQQKVSSLGFLSSSIAHEIKNQLGALRIITEHLMTKYYSDKPDDSEDKKLMTMIHNEIVNATKVPERLLKLMRNRDISYTTFDCSASISETIEVLDYEAKINGVAIELENSPQPVMLNGNETDFKIATINIILNAVKAMPHQGLLKIKISSSAKSGIKISFTDTGCGISKENLNKIFTPFFSHGNQSKIANGTGLGLSIAKSIIEKQGGTISVTSTVGKGSCFTFNFPPQKDLPKPKQHTIKTNKQSSKRIKKDE